MGAGMKPNGGIDLFDMHTWYMMTIKEEFPFERDWRRVSQVSIKHLAGMPRCLESHHAESWAAAIPA